MAQVVEIFSYIRQELTYYIVNIMYADILVMQGARASAVMMFIMSNQINLVPAHSGLRGWETLKQIPGWQWTKKSID